jgi:hypothetical protein
MGGPHSSRLANPYLGLCVKRSSKRSQTNVRGGGATSVSGTRTTRWGAEKFFRLDKRFSHGQERELSRLSTLAAQRIHRDRIRVTAPF